MSREEQEVKKFNTFVTYSSDYYFVFLLSCCRTNINGDIMILSAATKYKRSQHAILPRNEILTHKVAKLQRHFLNTKKDDTEEKLDSKEVENVVNSELQTAIDVIERVRSKGPRFSIDKNDEGFPVSAVEDSRSLSVLRTLQLQEEVKNFSDFILKGLIS